MPPEQSTQLGRLRDWGLVILLAGASFLAQLDRFALSVLQEPVKKSLGLADYQLGLLNGVAFGLFYVGMSLPLGWLADAWSRKKTILWCISIWSLATSLCGLTRTYGELLVTRMAVGVGEAGLVPSGLAIIRDRINEGALARAVSVFALGGYLGGGASLLVTSWLYGAFSSSASLHAFEFTSLSAWQLTFIALGLPGILVLLALSGFADSDPRPTTAPTVLSRGESIHRSAWLTYGFLFFAMAGLISITYGLLSWGPSIMAREFGLSVPASGAYYGYLVLFLSPVAIVAGGLTTDFLVRRNVTFPHRKIVFVASLVSLPCCIALLWANNVTAFLTVCGLIHFCVAFPLGTSAAYIQLITPRHLRSRMSAVYVMVTNLLGLGVAPVLIGLVSDLRGSVGNATRLATVSVVVPLAVLATGCALALILRRNQDRMNSEVS